MQSRRKRLATFSLVGLLAALAATLVPTFGARAWAAVPWFQQDAWATYSNSVYGYTVSYPPSWHTSKADPRIGQYFANYDPSTIGGEIPAQGTYTTLTITPVLKSASESLSQWIADHVENPDYKHETEDIPTNVERSAHVGGLPAVIYHIDGKSPRITSEFIDGGSVIFVITLTLSSDADVGAGQRALASFHRTSAPNLNAASFSAETGKNRVASAQTQSNQSQGQQAASVAFQWLTLPLSQEYGSGSYIQLSMRNGAVNSWFDHYGPSHSGNGIRFDGGVLYSSCTLGDTCYTGHQGIDFSTGGATGRNVYASDSGTIHVDTQAGGNMCLWVRSAGWTNLRTQYCHLSQYLKSENQYVNRGDLIGISGNTGGVGPHLHFAAFDYPSQKFVDPFYWKGSGADPWSIDGTYGYLWQSTPPAFIGGYVHEVLPSISGTWTSFTNFGYSNWWKYSVAISRQSTGSAFWQTPVSTCTAAEVYVPAGNATTTNARYEVVFSDNSSVVVSINQNATTGWITLSQNFGKQIKWIDMSDYTGTSGEQIDAGPIWFGNCGS